MPLVYRKTRDTRDQLAVWKITEDEDFFKAQLNWTSPEKAHFESLHEKRRIEWLSSRLLICQLAQIPNTEYIIKDNHGKPFIKDSQVNISISHTTGYVSAYVSPHSIGIDIQTFVEKIHRIAHKFIDHEKLHLIPPKKLLHALHIYWGAKEALYKAYGRKQLNYREHIKIDLDPILRCNEEIVDLYPFQFKGFISKGSYHQDFELTALAIEHALLIHCREV